MLARGSRRSISLSLETGVTTTISSRSANLAKLNPKCYMNYSIIFTEISFYPETSNCQYIHLMLQNIRLDD